MEYNNFAKKERKELSDIYRQELLRISVEMDVELIDIEEIALELESWGYPESDIPMTLELYGHLGIQGLLASLREYALRPSDPRWDQWQIDEKYPSSERHHDEGGRMHFCNCCGKPIFFPASYIRGDGF